MYRSDGAQPHLVNIQFQKKVRLQVCVWYELGAPQAINYYTIPTCFWILVRLCFDDIGDSWQELAIYTDYKADESYTPHRITIKTGNSFHDLEVGALGLSSSPCRSLIKCPRAVCRHIFLKLTGICFSRPFHAPLDVTMTSSSA